MWWEASETLVNRSFFWSLSVTLWQLRRHQVKMSKENINKHCLLKQAVKRHAKFRLKHKTLSFHKLTVCKHSCSLACVGGWPKAGDHYFTVFEGYCWDTSGTKLPNRDKTRVIGKSTWKLLKKKGARWSTTVSLLLCGTLMPSTRTRLNILAHKQLYFSLPGSFTANLERTQTFLSSLFSLCHTQIHVPMAAFTPCCRSWQDKRW